jgi:hypothetical protein
MDSIHAALAAMALAVALGSALCSVPVALHAAEIRSSAAASRAEDALTTLASRVSRQSHPGALRRAFHAYYSFQTAHPEQVRKPYLYFVDFGLDNLTPRGYVFDMVALRLIDGPFTVAHGRGSAPGAAAVPTRFSNIRSSYMTSLGLYLTEETYAFSGSASGRRYRSIGLRLRGLSGPFNSAARVRGIVVHGAPYVTSTRAGRSEGCPAMEESRAQWLLPRISNGALVFLFSPNDEVWMRNDPWVRGGVGPLAASGRQSR